MTTRVIRRKTETDSDSDLGVRVQISELVHDESDDQGLGATQKPKIMSGERRLSWKILKLREKKTELLGEMEVLRAESNAMFVERKQFTNYCGDMKPLFQALKVVRTEYDRTISESEAAFIKITESLQTLLSVIKRGGLIHRSTANDWR